MQLSCKQFMCTHILPVQLDTQTWLTAVWWMTHCKCCIHCNCICVYLFGIQLQILAIIVDASAFYKPVESTCSLPACMLKESIHREGFERQITTHIGYLTSGHWWEKYLMETCLTNVVKHFSIKYPQLYWYTPSFSFLSAISYMMEYEHQ